MNSSIPTRWADAVEAEIATFQWGTWWNETRPHENLGYRTPVEVEAEYWNTNRQQEIIETQGTHLGTKPGAVQRYTYSTIESLLRKHVNVSA